MSPFPLCSCSGVPPAASDAGAVAHHENNTVNLENNAMPADRASVCLLKGRHQTTPTALGAQSDRGPCLKVPILHLLPAADKRWLDPAGLKSVVSETRS